MALVRIPGGQTGVRLGSDRGQTGVRLGSDTSGDVTLREQAEVTAFLATHGIDYERWTPSQPIAADATAEAVLSAYAHEIDTL